MIKLKLNNNRNPILPTDINYVTLHGGQHSYVTEMPVFCLGTSHWQEKCIHMYKKLQ
jgi:hypothetical protein